MNTEYTYGPGSPGYPGYPYGPPINPNYVQPQFIPYVQPTFNPSIPLSFPGFNFTLPSTNYNMGSVLLSTDDQAVDYDGRLIIGIGGARSGKSTWSKKWTQRIIHDRFPIDNQPRLAWNTDATRLSITNQRYNRRAEPAAFMIKHYAIESMYLSGYAVFCDGTHTTKTSIRRMLEIDINATHMVFNPGLEVLRERAIATDQSDLLPVVERHQRQLDTLLEQGIDSVFDELRSQIEDRWKK